MGQLGSCRHMRSCQMLVWSDGEHHARELQMRRTTIFTQNNSSRLSIDKSACTPQYSPQSPAMEHDLAEMLHSRY